MKLALSNIAWPRSEDGPVAERMRAAGVNGVEIAPTAIWDDPTNASIAALRATRDWWAERDITIVALQALLFGHPELTIFESAARRRDTLDYLTRMMDVAAALGAGPMVFGSPKNRVRGTMSLDDATRIAESFFRNAGARARDRGVTLCLEPNPPDYGCDFVNTVAEGIALVNGVNETGFGLHVDAGAIAINGEPVTESITAALSVLRHFHASEPSLAPLGTGGTDHAACGAALRAVGYEGWVSVEMRAPSGGTADVARAMGILTANYGA